jgi:hypothetical protein
MQVASAILRAAVVLALPALAQAQVSIDRIKGSASRVGVAPESGDGNAQVRFQAYLFSDVPVDLSAVTLTIEALLEDAGGELVKGTGGRAVLPITLLPRSDAIPERGVYESSSASRPTLWARLKQRPGRLQLRIRVDRAIIPVHPCPSGGTVSLGTAFRINPAAGGSPLAVFSLQEWSCSASQLRSSASVGSSVSGGGDLPPAPGENRAPTARLVAEAITRNTGEPDLIELDGTGSEDPDGTIVRYVFDSGDGRRQDGPSPRAQFVYQPGDYRAALTVFDDRGAASAPVTRGFSDN